MPKCWFNLCCNLDRSDISNFELNPATTVPFVSATASSYHVGENVVARPEYGGVLVQNDNQELLGAPLGVTLLNYY